MDFKSQMQADMAVFLGTAEFADMHTINGVSIACVWDEDLSTERQKGQSNMGVYQDLPVLFLALSDLPARPRVRDRMTVDGQIYEVVNVSVSDGMAEISLKGNRS